MSSSIEKYILFEKGLLDADESFDVVDVLNDINVIEILPSMSKDARLSLYQKYLTEKESTTFDNFYNKAFGEELTFGAVESIINNGEITIRHPLNDDILKSRHSVQTKVPFRNFIRFQSSNDVLYVYQENFTFEAFFFPFNRLCVVIKHGSFDIRDVLSLLLSKLRNHIGPYSNYFFSTPSFCGIKTEHPSPYHWYYLKLQALSEILPRFAGKNKKVAVLTSSKGLFLRLDSIFPDVIENYRYVEEFISFDGNIIPSECFYNEFYFSIGFRMCFISSAEAEDMIKNKTKPLDDLVLKALKTFDSCAYNEVLCASENDHFILWLGITTGKRAWIEETDAYTELVKRLSIIHKNVTVILDGWTSTHQQNQEKQQVHELYGDDDKVKDKIIHKLQHLDNVNFLSLIGGLAEEKIAIASKVDFFVANHATGSLWVSRIARNNGVVHISNAARISSLLQHIHWDALLIPESVKPAPTLSLSPPASTF